MDAGHRQSAWVRWLSLATGLAALVWFLVRVIPKPSRAAYPCQRAAAPLGSGFVIWLAGLVGAKLVHRRAQALRARCRFAGAIAVLAMVVMALWLPLGAPVEMTAQQTFTPSEPPNQPIGVAKGIHPGRVVWVRQPEATRWDGKTGNWFDDANTDQKVVAGMMSDALRSLTGRQTDQQAWDALFRHFNQNRRLGNAGYRPGEKVVIKINANQDSGKPWRPDQGMPSPQAVYALVEQLAGAAGVPARDITIYDGSRYIGDPIYDKVKGNPAFQAVAFVVSPSTARNGRQPATEDKAHPIHYAQEGVPTAFLPTAVTEAKYLINFALLRAHTLCGVTLCAKNHFGSTFFPNDGGWTPRPLHETASRQRPMGSYNSLVDLNGHRHTGGKTLLYLLDALYTAEHQGGSVMRFESFGDNWVASLFVSQDPVAIDSVGVDLLRNEPRATQVRGHPDNYLHEAALAANPPSGAVYDPEKDGTRLASLGVHEHWNNPKDKQYSRNLGKGNGIELVKLGKTSAN